MNSPKPRKACNVCYQKKVRCNWSEDAPVCSYCMKNGLECLLPDPTQPAPRIAVREKLAEFDVRLQRLERESRNARRHSGGSLVDYSYPLIEELPLISPPGDLVGSLVGSTALPRVRPTSISSPIAKEYGEVPATSVATRDISGITRLLAPDCLAPQLPGNATSNPFINTEEDERDVRRFRGETSTWEVLVGSAAAVTPTLATGQFRETVNRLAEEERTTKSVAGYVEYDLLKELPGLTANDVFKYAEHYRREAPFPVVYWPRLEAAIEKGIETKRWTHWGEVVCVLMYISFGSAHLKISGPQRTCEAYFQKAWNMLPQLLFEQDLWALTGVTLMVHYLQGGSLPEPCYTLLGSASRMAISLGFHRTKYDKSYTVLEEEQGKRCWWLCYILESTFSLVLGRPSSNLEMCVAEIPRPFSTPNASSYIAGDSIFPINDDPNDEEAVGLFVDLIEVVRTRDEIVRSLPAREQDGSLHPQLTSNYESVADVLLHWKAASKLKRPLDFDTSNKGSLRATICDLAYYHTIISLDRYWKPDFASSMVSETLQSARATISLISEYHTDGMAMCLWMWLYYGFTAAVVLFLDVINSPLHSEATLNIALISDIEGLCSELAPYSAGAKRVMEVSKEMNRVALELIKSRAKRKAQEKLTGDSSRLKQHHIVDLESSHGTAFPGAGENDLQTQSFLTSGFPTNFSWDDWDQWLNDASL